jgi:HlyD family secretion protein
MLKLIKDLFPLLTDIQRKKFYLLQVLVVLMTFLELIGIASIVPFMTLLGNMELLNEEGWLSKLYVKRIFRMPKNRVILKCDNLNYPDINIDINELDIIAQVVYSINFKNLV